MLLGRSGGGAENQLPSQETLVLPNALASPSMLVPEAMMPRLDFRPAAVPPEGVVPPPVVGAVEAAAPAALLAGAETLDALDEGVEPEEPEPEDPESPEPDPESPEPDEPEDPEEPEAPDPAADDGLAEGVVGDETESGSSVGLCAEPCVPVPDVVAAAAAPAWTVTVTVGLAVTVTVAASHLAPSAESESVPELEPVSALAASVPVPESEPESDPVCELADSASVPVEGVWVLPSALAKATVSVASAFTV